MAPVEITSAGRMPARASPMDVAEYLPMFLAEGREHLQELNLSVVRIEEHPDEAPDLPHHTPKARPDELCPACNKQPLEHTDTVIFAPSWSSFLYSCLPRGPPRIPRRRERAA